MNEMSVRDKQNSQSGQALVEYVLLLVIVVALILGLANQLYRPFGDWMKDYMGPYLECLIDVGELPTIGGSSDSGECNTRFKPGNAASSNDKQRNPSEKSGTESMKDPSARSGSSGETASGGARGSKGRSFASGGQKGADSLGGTKSEKQVIEKLPESQFFKNRSSSSYLGGNRSGQGRPPQTLTVPMVGSDENAKKEKAVKISEEEFNGPQREGKKLLVKPPERKPTAEEDDKPWDFSQYIKFALIIIIIIAIVLFLGGQVLQISKSMEK